MYNWHDEAAKVGKYWTVHDVTQGDKRRIPVSGSQVEKNVINLSIHLDRIRLAWGHPIGVSSWYRPPKVNAEVGGVSNSQHINGSAADIYPIDGDVFAFQAWLDKHWDRALGYGAKKGFVHVDLREGRIRWNY